MSGTRANDCLLLWVATRCCARLQKLVLSNSQASGAWTVVGSAVLLTPAAAADACACVTISRVPILLLCPPAPPCAGRGLGLLLRAKRALLAAGRSGALPLLELAAAGTTAFRCSSAELGYCDNEPAQAAGVQARLPRGAAACGVRCSWPACLTRLMPIPHAS